MKITDRIYGTYTIDSPIFLELINPYFKQELEVALTENKKGTKSGIILYN